MGREIEKPKGETLKANKSVDSLKSMKMESDKAAELYKSRLENLSPRISRIEEDIADMLTVKVGDLAGLSHNLGSFIVEGDGGNLNFLDCWGKCDIFGNGSTPEDAEAVVLSRGSTRLRIIVECRRKRKENEKGLGRRFGEVFLLVDGATRVMKSCGMDLCV
ncbi:translation initiation factor IF-2 [Striga asiatica]|uniref:Translation initiation factor IF-2 n=1 Tax=Striga asiatica TaxID=4170 RepID=A0A5A7NXM0_STRAF|nr:translation initiation factor IF-2 [Striga asiatica]